MLVRFQNKTPMKFYDLFDNEVLLQDLFADRLMTYQLLRHNKFVNDDKSISYEVEVPGFDIGDIDLSTNERKITISCKKDNVKIKELLLCVDKQFDCATAKANLKNGLLTITLFPQARPPPQRIAITVE